MLNKEGEYIIRKRIYYFMFASLMPCFATFLLVLKVVQDMSNYGSFDLERNMPFIIIVYLSASILSFGILLYVKYKKI